MLRSWSFAKRKQHDASGVRNPSDWKWEKDVRQGIYYPVEKVPEKRPKKK